MELSEDNTCPPPHTHTHTHFIELHDQLNQGHKNLIISLSPPKHASVPVGSKSDHWFRREIRQGFFKKIILAW